MENRDSTTRSFSVPSGIGYDAYQGSMQQILRDNIGHHVDVEFLIGTNFPSTRSGILRHVGAGYIVLFDPKTNKHTICDLYSIKFATIGDNPIR